MSTSRRDFVRFLAGGAGAGWLVVSGDPFRAERQPEPSSETTGPLATFPHQDPALVRETVAVSHGNLPRLQELVDAFPELAKAAWDWGFGDWETALGAASHMGHRPIAEFLLTHGARLDLFAAAMLGDLAVVRGLIVAHPGIQGTPGPHGLTLLAHARAGRDPAREVVAYLESVGGADPVAATVPADRAARLAGEYVFGPGPQDRFTITWRDERLEFHPENGTARRLLRVADDQVHPSGAPSIVLRFEPSGRQPDRVIIDRLGLTASRVDP